MTRSRRSPARLTVLLALAALGASPGAALATPRPGPPATAPTPAPAGSSTVAGTGTADACTRDPAWAPATTRPDPANTYHAYTGNGYLGVRVPPSGAGYAEPGDRTGWPLYTPRYDGAFAAGLYARGPENTAHREAVAALPNWTALDLTVGDETYGPDSRISGYRQTLSLRCGFVRTSLTWEHKGGRRTDLTYDVLTDRSHAHTGAVRLRVTPRWSGEATVTDRIDGRGARRIAPTGGGPAGKRTMAVGFRTDGTRTDGVVASTLRAPGRTHAARPTGTLTARQSASFSVDSGHTYTVTKYIGVDTALTSRTPHASAVGASQRAAAAGWAELTREHTAAWRKLWTSDIEVPDRPELQLQARAARYGLLSSVRAGGRDSIAPAGLTSDAYAGMVFWDAETWMFPALLADRPDLARPVLEYRYRTREAAAENARKTSVKGLFYPWTSASRGALWTECQSWQPPHCVTQNHLQGDIALAAWQYYLATGDHAWLRSRGWPLLKGLAQYWSSRVTKNADGSYSIKDVAGPDEYSNGVDDGVYTNAVAATALRSAARAARLVGTAPPADWTTIADRLRIPYDTKRKVFLQYAGYDGSTIKQADAVLLLYPLGWKPMPKGAAAATLDYYVAHTDPDGPAMTDSVHAVAAASAGEPGCATYTFLRRASKPFFRGPFGLFSEARGTKAGSSDPLAGTPAQDFLTGKGGFLQVFTHGLTGLRLQEDALRLDPSLPPQLGRGVTLRGLTWRGRTYDIAIGPRRTTVRLTAGEPFPVVTPAGRATVDRGGLVLRTRRPDLEPTSDLARCRPAKATSEEPGLYAEAAVDGNPVTAWRPATAHASLTVDLGRSRPLSGVDVTGTRAYAVTTSADGAHWRAFTPGRAARYVRLTENGAKPEPVKELRVR
ncbi:glycosyl hydrolase family 65 protein [Streptomyces antnestii]|uniref:glycosyl hydrolase family 65 protein n=1 Tax=Streptomyces antnestii TaxID=2494256 RepID=UPI001CB97828|nr:glycosyl hydrolase family 65 protein [Streptomyces sp. San01]